MATLSLDVWKCHVKSAWTPHQQQDGRNTQTHVVKPHCELKSLCI